MGQKMKWTIIKNYLGLQLRWLPGKRAFILVDDKRPKRKDAKDKKKTNREAE